MCCKKPAAASLPVRCVLCLLGIVIMAFGIALMVKINLGISPLSILPYVASLHWRPTFGEFTGLYNLFLVALQMALLRKNFPKRYFLQLPTAFLFTVFIDMWMLLLPELSGQPYALRLAALCAGVITSGLGIFLEITGDVVMLPGEGAVKALATVLRRDFGMLKICFDLCCIACGLLLSFALFRGFRGFGEGTILSGVFTGVCVRQYRSLYRRFVQLGSTR